MIRLLVTFFYLDSRKIFAEGVTRAAREQLTHQKYKDALFLPVIHTSNTEQQNCITFYWLFQSINFPWVPPMIDASFLSAV